MLTARAYSWLPGLAVALVGRLAFADVVELLPSGGAAAESAKTSVYNAADLAVTSLAHQTVGHDKSAPETDGTSASMVSLGKAAGANWVVQATVTPAGAPAAALSRVELKACQVSTGRVETLTRDLDLQGDVSSELRPMLVLLLRPQGVGDDPLPWEKPKDQPLQAAPKPAPGPPPAPYHSSGDYALGAAVGVSDLFARPSSAVGSRLVGRTSIVGSTALSTLFPSLSGDDDSIGRRVDLVATIDALFIAAGALRATVGAQYMVRFTPESPFAIGLGASLGLVAQTGGARAVRPLFGVSPILGVALTRGLELEVHPGSLDVAPGAEGALALVGGDLRLLARF